MAEFEQAHQRFLAQLSDEEKQQFSPIKDYTTFKAVILKLSESKKSSKFTKLLNVVNKCGQSLASYFEVVGIVVQSHPEWAGLAWGSLRLILALASNYVSFFEKLENLFERLNRVIRGYQELSAQFKKLNTEINVSSEFSSSLQAFYIDVLEIFRGIARIFTKKTGELRSNTAVIGQLLWQPFEVRFSDILLRFDEHRRILLLEMDAIHLQTTTNIALTQKEESSRADRLANAVKQRLKAIEKLIKHVEPEFSNSDRERIAAWINPGPFAETYERLNDLRQDGTAEWIFQTEEYKDWASTNSSSNCLWVRGNPGAGKSVLAASVVQELLQAVSMTDGEPILTTYFFFEYNGADGKGMSRDQAYRAILAQLFHQFVDDEEVLDVFAFAHSSNTRHGQLIATTNELLDLLKIFSPRIHNWSVVIDGVDECETANELSQDLDDIFKGVPTKILLFSRPNVSFLRHSIPVQQTLSVSRIHNQEDLRAYFKLHLDRFLTLGAIPKSTDVRPLVDALLLSADGMFQWARLMITHLSSDGLSPRQRVTIIGSLRTPENLDDMYERILAFLSKKLLSERKLARSIFLWLNFAKKPLTVIQLQDILTPYEESSQTKDGWIKRIDDDSLTDFETSTILVTGGLVEKRWSPKLSTNLYTFIHGSVQDFFESRCGTAEAPHNETNHSIKYFLPPTYQAHSELANNCLLYICKTIPGKPLAGNMFETISAITLSEVRPFVNYAALYWPHHLFSMDIPGMIKNADSRFGNHESLEIVLKTLENFLSSTFTPMVWVELLYTFDNRDDGHSERREKLKSWARSVGDLTATMSQSKWEVLSAATLELTVHLEKLHELWGGTLILSPHKIWHDITAFTPNPFFVTTQAVTVKPLESEHPMGVESGQNPLLKISRDHSRKDLLAILQIWPPRGFQNMPPRIYSEFSGTARFDGWTAQYEIWSISSENPVIVEVSHLPLDPKEVQLQYDTFSIPSSSDCCMAIHFPTSIREDLECFTVLTTVYRRRKPLPSASERSHPVIQTNLWESTTIPIKKPIHARMHMKTWRSAQEDVRASSFANRLDTSTSSSKLYTPSKFPSYELTVHNDYVIYQSNEGCGILDRIEKIRRTLSVYKLGDEEQDNTAKLLGTVECSGNFGNMSPATLHPNRFLLAFHFAAISGKSRILLWQLNEKMNIKPEHIHLDSALCRLSMEGSTGSLTSIPLLGRLSNLQFDSSGKQLIYLYKNASYPCILDITSFQIFQGSQNWTKTKTLDQEPALPSVTKTEISEAEAPVAVHTICTQRQDLGESRFHTEGSSMSLSLYSKAACKRSKNVHRELKIQYSDARASFEQEILSLPAWEDADQISASVYPSPTVSDDRITVVLNKKSKCLYELDERVKPTPPMIVTKDKRAITLPKLVRSLPGCDSATQKAISWVDEYQPSGEEQDHPTKIRYSTE
ncbi:hypothetical protein IQ07DRAFT_235234 [Pyrenochaeta sp. DS3sAY3a]|nr:hypothetical protein IQ07DRAFT_235234 [Pyrenochaeta sp. DS3sAY3a]